MYLCILARVYLIYIHACLQLYNSMSKLISASLNLMYSHGKLDLIYVLYLYLCVYICICVYKRVYIYTCIFEYIYKYICICVCIYVHTHVQIYIKRGVVFETTMCVYMYVCWYIDTYTNICMYIYTCTYICVYVYVHMPV